MEGARKNESNDGYSLNGHGFTVIKATPEKIWTSILNPDELISLIPGCKSLTRTAPLSFNADAKIGVGPIAGNFTADFQFCDLVQHRSLSLTGTASGPLGIAAGTGQITLEPNDEEVKVGYSYSITINGKIAAVGARLLAGVVRRLIEQTVNNFVYELQDSSPSSILFKIFRWLGIRN
jgi:2-furoyl-CoA dehydrogenase large subunit